MEMSEHLMINNKDNIVNITEQLTSEVVNDIGDIEIKKHYESLANGDIVISKTYGVPFNSVVKITGKTSNGAKIDTLYKTTKTKIVDGVAKMQLHAIEGSILRDKTIYNNREKVEPNNNRRHVMHQIVDSSVIETNNKNITKSNNN